MYRQHQLGQDGEALARKFLEAEGFEVIVTNWRSGQLELDIIAQKNHVLHIVEVKTQRSITAGHPEESVTRTKFQHLQRAAESFINQYPQWKIIQFDIIAVTISKQGEAEILLIEDIYY